MKGTLLVYHHQNATNACFLVAEAVKAFEALAPAANPTKRLTRSATGIRKLWRSARSVLFWMFLFHYQRNTSPKRQRGNWQFILFSKVETAQLLGKSLACAAGLYRICNCKTCASGSRKQFFLLIRCLLNARIESPLLAWVFMVEISLSLS